MRRVAAVLTAILALLATPGAAGAQEETPSGTFSSPTRAVAGAPIWVRSITPCPVTPGAYQFVRVGISAQSEPSIDYIESTDDDLAADGSWMVTLSAPADMPKGITKSYEIQAQCIEHDTPYLAPSRDATSEPVSTQDPLFSYKRYFMRPLYVTGFGGTDAEVAGAPTGDTTTTTTTTTTTAPASSTLAADSLESASLRSAGLQSSGQKLAGLQHGSLEAATTTTWVSDEAERAAEARAELARSTESADDDVTLSAAPVVATTPRPAQDPGIPWWSFVLATMLAVGGVIGFGQRRRNA